MVVVGRNPVHIGARSRLQLLLPAGALILLAIEVFCFALIGFGFLVLRVTWGPSPEAAAFVADPIWTLLCGFTLVLGSTLLWFASRAAQHRQIAGTVLVGLTCLYGILAIGFRVVDLGGRPQPHFIDPSSILGMPTASTARPRKKSAAAVTGRPDAGKPFFLATCAACHGPAGQGIAGTAPAYSATDFVSKSDEGSLSRMIQIGRAINDPENKSKRAMPSQGGNPFLTPQNVRDIAAYIKTLDPGASSGVTPGGNPATALALPNWVVPGAAVSTVGLKPEAARQWSDAQWHFAAPRHTTPKSVRRAEFLTGLFRAWGVTHLVHLSAAAIGLLVLFASSLPRERKWLDDGQVSVAAWWWHVGTGSWLLFSTLFFLVR